MTCCLFSCLIIFLGSLGQRNKYFCFHLLDPVLPVWVGRSEIIFLTSQIGYSLNLIVYSKTCLKRPLRKKTKNCLFFQVQVALNAGQKYCRMLLGSILQYFQPAFSAHLSKRNMLCISLSGHFRQVLLFSPTKGNKIKYTNNLLR